MHQVPCNGLSVLVTLIGAWCLMFALQCSDWGLQALDFNHLGFNHDSGTLTCL